MRKFLVKTSQFPKQEAVMGISGLHQAITTMPGAADGTIDALQA